MTVLYTMLKLAGENKDGDPGAMMQELFPTMKGLVFHAVFFGQSDEPGSDLLLGMAQAATLLILCMQRIMYTQLAKRLYMSIAEPEGRNLAGVRSQSLRGV